MGLATIESTQLARKAGIAIDLLYIMLTPSHTKVMTVFQDPNILNTVFCSVLC